MPNRTLYSRQWSLYHGSGYVYFTLSITELEHNADDLANNRSRISYSMTAQCSSNWCNLTSYTDTSASIGSISMYNAGGSNNPYAVNTGLRTIFEGTQAINHDADGTKTISLSGNWKWFAGSNNVQESLSGTYTLTPISVGTKAKIHGNNYYCYINGSKYNAYIGGIKQ